MAKVNITEKRVSIQARTRVDAGFPDNSVVEMEVELGGYRGYSTYMLPRNPTPYDVFQCLAALAKSFERTFQEKGLMNG